MWIEVEPNGTMARIKIGFARGQRGTADRRVQEYLRERGLAPKRITIEEAEGESVEVWQYGQCYLGFHLRDLYAFQWQGALGDTLAQALRDPDDLAPLAPDLADDEVPELAWQLAGALIEHKAAAPDKDDPSVLHFDEDVLKRELGRLVAARAS